MTVALKYPMGSAGSSDYVTFTPERFKFNKNRSANQASSPPADAGAVPVTLYMPNSTPSIGNGNRWTGHQMIGPIGNASLEAGAAVGQLVGRAMNGDFPMNSTGGTRLLEALKARANSVKENVGLGGAAQMIGHAGMQAAQGLIGISPNQQLALGTGNVFNPNQELFYSSPSLRPFSMSFDFVAKNAAEAEMINKIIFNFKKWSAPKDLQNGMFQIPYVWRVRYMTNGKENPNMNKFKKAACTNIQVQANAPTPMHVAHMDGVPIITTLSLSFMECDIIIRQDHEEVGGQGY